MTSSGPVQVSTLVPGVSSPCDGSVDSKGKYLYVALNTTHKVVRIDTATTGVTTLAGSGSAGSADGTGTGATFNGPGCATLDPNDEFLYTFDINSNRVRKVNVSTGVVTTVATSVASSYAVAVAVAPTNDYLYVPCSSNNIIVRIQISNGTKNTVAGSGAGTTDGTGTTAKFNGPRGCAVDRAGANLYVCDITNNRVRKIALNGGGTNAGTVSTLAGNNTASSVDGTGDAATFNQPLSCALDPTETYLYVAEFGAHRIRRIELATTVVTTVAGSTAGSVDGNESVATFNGTSGIFRNKSVNNIYYTGDQNSNKVRKLEIAQSLTWGQRV